MSVQPLIILAATETFGHDADEWTLATPKAAERRTYARRVAFERTFSSAPIVHIGLVGFDIGNADAARVRCHAVDITSEGFTASVETWLATRIWSVSVSWIALGQ